MNQFKQNEQQPIPHAECSQSQGWAKYEPFLCQSNHNQ